MTAQARTFAGAMLHARSTRRTKKPQHWVVTTKKKAGDWVHDPKTQTFIQLLKGE